MDGSASLTSASTFDVTIEASAAGRYAGTLWKRVLQPAGVPANMVSAADGAAIYANATTQDFATYLAYAADAAAIATVLLALYPTGEKGGNRSRHPLLENV